MESGRRIRETSGAETINTRGVPEIGPNYADASRRLASFQSRFRGIRLDLVAGSDRELTAITRPRGISALVQGINTRLIRFHRLVKSNHTNALLALWGGSRV